MNRGKMFSGIVALLIYMLMILTILFFYNIHQVKAKNYVKKNENRVTVTLVNSDKTVLNRSDKRSNKNKPTPLVTPPIPLKTPQKIVPKKKVASKKVQKVSKPIHKKIIPRKVVIPKKVKPKKVVKPKPKKRVVVTKKIPKKTVPKKIAPKKRVPKKVVKKLPKKKIPKKVVKKIPKKKVPKKVVKKAPKKKVPKKVVPKKKVPKKSAKDLFSSVKTKNVKKHPIKKAPRHTRSTAKRPSSIKHRSSVADRIKASQQSGRPSNANRDKGIKNAYIAKVKRHMNNWNAAAAHKGKRVTIALTIYNSGKFSYRIIQGSGSIRGSLSQYLNQLKKIGLGRHSKSTPYSIKVSFTVR